MDVRRIASGIINGKYDKTVHGVLSFLVSMTGFFFLPVAAAVLIAAGLGLAKELYDATRRGDHFDIADLLADLGGITAAYFMWIMIVKA